MSRQSSHPHAPATADFDIVMVGGGLANGLIALALLSQSKAPRVALVESAAAVGGNHTWSFHWGDVPEAARSFVEPLIDVQWSGYQVRFPELQRRLGLGYASFGHESLRRQLEAAFANHPESRLLLGAAATSVEPHRVTLDDATTLTAELVIDGRGPTGWVPDPNCRFQKFVGLELELRQPSPATEPLLMDAMVGQDEGLRFVYVLPFEPHRVLIEDTYFSDSSALDQTALEQRVLEYAAQHGYDVANVLRREHGVLPLPLEMPRFRSETGLLRSGFQGGWFHPTTGYSFPVAVQLAEFVARKVVTGGAASVVGDELDALARARAGQQRYLCWLNRLLYGAFPKHQRWSVMQRFYGLPEETIARFYAMQTSGRDRLRIVCGRPPQGLSLIHALFPPRVAHDESSDPHPV